MKRTKLEAAFHESKLPIIAAYDKEDEGDINLRLMKCPKTGVSVLANAMIRAISPFAKNTVLEEVAKDTTSLSVNEQKSMSEAGTCTDCGTSYCSTAKLSEAMKEGFNCIVCGNGVLSGHNELEPNFDEYEVEDDEDRQVGGKEKKLHQIIPQDDEYVEHEDSQVHESPEEKGKDTEDDEWKDSKHNIHPQFDEYEEKENDEIEESPEEKAKEKKLALSNKETAADKFDSANGEDELSEEKKNTEFGEKEPSEEEHDLEKVKVGDADEEDSEGKVTDDNPEISEEFEGLKEGQAGEDNITANLIKIAQTSKDKRVDVIATSGADPVYYVMLDHKPVGLIRKADLSKTLQGVFSDSATFSKTVMAALSNGLDKAVEEFKIEAIKVEVPVDEAVAVHLDETRKELEASFEAKKAELMNVLKQSISIASIATNKEVFKDIVNPLKSELVAKLTQNGVEQPESIVNSAFETSMGKYIETVLSKAYELVEKPTEVRNDFARMVESANYRQATVGAVEEAVIKRLHNPMTSTEVTASTSTPSDSGESSVEKIRGVIRLSKYRSK